MKQTAVEWLEQQLYKAGWEQLTHEEKMNVCCTAKMMERDEIVEAYDADHVKQLIQKNDDLIILIEEV